MIDEQLLIKQLLEQRPSAYRQLIDAYERLLFTICAGILINPGKREDVEEVVADCFAALWENIEQYDPSRGSLKGYLCSMARSRAIDRLRMICRRRELPIEEAAEMPNEQSPLSMIIQEETVLSIWRYLQRFPEPDCNILTLRFFYELKPADIAAKLQLPVSQIYDRIRSGKEKLQSFINSQEVKT